MTITDLRTAVIYSRRRPHARPSFDSTRAALRELSEAGRLRATWALIADPSNWKNPIDAVVIASEASPEAIRAAVAHYTGAVAEVTPCQVAVRHPRGLMHFLAPAFRVTSPGYYATIGA